MRADKIRFRASARMGATTEPVSLLIPFELRRAMRRKLNRKGWKLRDYFEALVRSGSVSRGRAIPVIKGRNPCYQEKGQALIKKGVRVDCNAWQLLKNMALSLGYSAAHLFVYLVRRDLETGSFKTVRRQSFKAKTTLVRRIEPLRGRILRLLLMRNQMEDEPP